MQQTNNRQIGHQMTEQEEQIIEVVVVIFQNVGIKRSINRIQIFKNYQIYFQICKVIFPQTMIQLFRLSQDELSIAQKIQGVIKIVGKMLQNDLYHISGQAIADGKLGHIKNFLHILELLSENVHKVNTKDDQIESAPENTKSISDYDQQGHYTVIGIDKEFQRSAEDDDGNFYYQRSQQKQIPGQQQPETKRQFPQSSNKKRNGLSERQKEFQVEKEERSQSQESNPDQMGPVLVDKPIITKVKNKSLIKRKKPTQKPKQFEQQRVIIQKPVRPHSYNYNNYELRRPKVKPVNLQNVIQKPQKQKRVQIKSAFLKKINNSIEDLQVKRIQDMQIQHNQWVREHQLSVVEKENQIQHQNRQRIQFTNELIGQRQKHIQSMKGQKQAVKVMANLFQEQKSIWKGMKKAKQQAQMQDILSLVTSHWEDQTLLREAILSGNNKGYGKNKVRAY